MSILVTGGAGFIGSHLVDKFIANDYKTIVVDNLFSGKIENVNPKAEFYNIDITKPDLEKVFEENKIEYIFHYAAQASVSISEENPVLDANSNIIGTINLLNFAKKYNVKKIITASTAAVYGNPNYLPVDENHSINPLSFYGLSKLTMESYVKLSGIDYIIFRFSNVYGPRQDVNGEAGVVSIFIDKFISELPIDIHGDGKQIRDFIYVEDLVNANILAIESQATNQIMNISTNTASSILDLTEILSNSFNHKSQIRHINKRSEDIKESVLDNLKAQELLNWTPKINLNLGINLTITKNKTTF